MSTMKFKKQERMTRTEAATRLREIAEAIRKSQKFEMDHGEEQIELDIPDEVSLEFEVEIEDGKTELEVELKWASSATSTTSAE